MPFELFLRAGEQTLDIAAVAPDHERRDGGGENGIKDVVRKDEKRGDRHARRGGNGAEGDIFRREPQHHEQPPRHERHAPVEH